MHRPLDERSGNACHHLLKPQLVEEANRRTAAFVEETREQHEQRGAEAQ